MPSLVRCCAPMIGMLSSRVTAPALLLLAYAVMLAAPSAAQEPAAETVPADWQSLSTAEFIELAQAAIKPAAANPAELIADLRKEAVRRVSDEVLVSSAKLSDLARLRQLAASELDDEAKAVLLSRVQQRNEQTVALDFDDLKARYTLIQTLSPSPKNARWRPDASRMVADWVAAHDISTLALDKCHWLLPRLNQAPQGVRSFSVTWTGTITSPRTGAYEFFASPHNINIDEGPNFYYRAAMRVEVDGAVVLDATSSNWTSPSITVNLVAETPVALRVTYSYECATAERLGAKIVQIARSPHAVLEWRGANFSRTPVPAAALHQQPGGEPGLIAEYHLLNRQSKQETVESITEANIDHAWMGGAGFISRFPAVERAVADRLWEIVTAPDYWQACSDAPEVQSNRTRHLLIQYPRHAARLSAGRRQEFLRQLLARPAILQRLPLSTVFNIYHYYRYGAEDEAIAVLGEWMQLHPAPVPRPAASIKQFYALNRYRYRNLCIPAFWIYPTHAQVLEEEYLSLPDGSCCLPVAYLLAYGYLERGAIDAWIAKVEDQLSQDNVGDVRASWLLARGMAEEIRNNPASPSFTSPEALTAGMAWLEEAQSIASHARQAAIQTERVARLTACREWTALDAVGELPSELAEQVNAVRSALANRKVTGDKAAAAAYAKELRQRRQRLWDAGDEQGAARYSEIISELESADQ